MKTSDFDYRLPSELIAQTPIEPRDHSRLMVLHRANGSIEHRRFYELTDYIDADDVLVFNNSRVIPARILGQKEQDNTKVEILLLRQLDNGTWQSLVRPGRKAISGTRIRIESRLDTTGAEMIVEVVACQANGTRIIRFSGDSQLEKFGHVPLPPYIHTPLADPGRYQTVYAKIDGSVAAPTAGLHFTRALLERLRRKGVHLVFVTLHIGLDTFRPVKVDDPGQHSIHKEYGEITQETAVLLNEAKRQGRKIIAVGTTSVRLIEAAAQAGTVQPFTGWVDLFILPGYRFRITDAMITNFHLPRSTLLMLVSAFAGRDSILTAYEEAERLGYRFYSFGDAMLIL
ncbi:MAG TPA: tRNA preQ1(34) S-adenosylmethionine ribosyltransferase-isomerase QueA [Dehalococcoidia bacterium]|nr:tRNA preQ1(34) S-adenosylmethionine ribosyltransferase-isomerase QueA [Dehalococcoidia bacterium]